MPNLLLCVTGGIAAYKAANLARLLIKDNYSVKVVMTHKATEFITPLTLSTLTNNPVTVDDFDKQTDPLAHINLAKWADTIVVAPTTANTIAKLACGLADNLLTSIILASKAKVLICPAMNTNMYLNPATQFNLTKISSYGYHILTPDKGELACGDTGDGKLPDPENILKFIKSTTNNHENNLLKGKKILVTAGPTVEKIDPVRFISNFSSGKMGYSIAKNASEMGAETLLISGPVKLEPVVDNIIYVNSASEMLDKVKENIQWCDILIMTAAVADYAPDYSPHKIKKSNNQIIITLNKNPDILKEMAQHKRKDQIYVGFAAETDELENNALKKLKEKSLDFIVANDIKRNDIGFNSDDNEVTIYSPDGSKLSLKKQSKNKIAKIILENINRRINNGG